MKPFLHVLLALGVVTAVVLVGIHGMPNAAVTAQSRVSHVSMIALGADHSCAIDASGILKCWGKNLSGQLGIGSLVSQGDTPSTIGTGMVATDLNQTVKFVSGGEYHTCAIRADNSTVCWGEGNNGELGTESTGIIGDGPGEMGSNLVAVDFGTSYASALSASDTFTCALLATGAVKCWGRNDNGRLGVDGNHGGSTGTMGTNLPAVDLGTGRTATAIATGQSFACALLDNKTVKCWGDNSFGQLGQGDTAARTYPNLGDSLAAINLGTGRTAKAIAAGGHHACAILDTGSVKCWGLNDYGQLGINSKTTKGDGANEMGNYLAAVNLGTGRTAVKIAAARRADNEYTCAILDNAAVKCWGGNDIGQLGQGDTNARGDQTGEMAALGTVNLGTNVTALDIAVGAGHTCVRINTTDLKCFGHGDRGKLGSGATDNIGTTKASMGNALPILDLDGVTPTVTKTLTRSKTYTRTKTLTRTKTRTPTRKASGVTNAP